MYPEVREVLDYLYNHSYALAICTNKPRKLVDKILTELKLYPYFHFILAGDDLPTSKHHPENLFTCLKNLDLDANHSFYIGDSTVDQILALRTQTPFGFYKNGYDDGVELKKAHLVLNTHSDVLKIL